MNLANLQDTRSTIRFSAKLLSARSKPSGNSGAKDSVRPSAAASLVLPRSASAKIARDAPSQASMTMVEGLINGFPFRAALESCHKTASKGAANSNGVHRLWLSDALQDAVGAEAKVNGGGVGTMTVEITRIGDEPEVRVPADFRKALDAAAAAQPAWTDITPMARREWILWITSARQEETRRRRIENACDMLASGKRRPCCMPGINWRVKDFDITPDETWIALDDRGKRTSRPAERASKRSRRT